MKLGARDYLTKPWHNERLLAACHAQTELRRAAVSREQRLRDVRAQRAALDASHSFKGIIGVSASMVNVLRMVADVAPTTASVLITGPAGTGKELIAQALHQNSTRAQQPFVAVHVGALADGLFERELFGHVRGAFTDARTDQPGRFAMADQGTLFLDEIGTLKPAQQLKLLRVLQEGEFEALGSTRTQHVDVRVIAATNVDLQAELAAGRFREDLYYRLQVVELYLQPLRDRPDDIMPCANEFLRRSAARNRKQITGFAPPAESALLAYSWPGNIRELENLVERAVIFSRGTIIETVDLPLCAAAATPSSLSEVERATVVKALAVHHGNISHTAAALGLSRAALYRRLAKYGLH
jgi:DNA-binding NtrC family response regulator